MEQATDSRKLAKLLNVEEEYVKATNFSKEHYTDIFTKAANYRKYHAIASAAILSSIGSLFAGAATMSTYGSQSFVAGTVACFAFGAAMVAACNKRDQNSFKQEARKEINEKVRDVVKAHNQNQLAPTL